MRVTRANVERYRAAEARLWEERVGVHPFERMIGLPGLGLRVRVLESGGGPTLLFIHGGPNAASTWAPLVAKLQGFRCVLVDRPGCGLSDAPPHPIRSVRSFSASLVAELVDALGADLAGLVASSFGSYAVLAHSVGEPEAGLPTVHFGCPALVPGSRPPLRLLLRSMPGLRGILLRLEPPTTANALESFRSIGHGASIDAGRVPEAWIEWYAALLARTETRENDLAMFGRIRPRDRLTERDLAKITARTSFFWGTGDAFGGRVVAEGVRAMIPDALLEVIEGAGHLPWIDAPSKAGRHVRAFFEKA
jgi:2-hydroxy-6-oxonona-2,4-dienedioate hydrolase